MRLAPAALMLALAVALGACSAPPLPEDGSADAGRDSEPAGLDVVPDSGEAGRDATGDRDGEFCDPPPASFTRCPPVMPEGDAGGTCPAVTTCYGDFTPCPQRWCDFRPATFCTCRFGRWSCQYTEACRPDGG